MSCLTKLFAGLIVFSLATVGVVQLVEAQAHGESFVLPFVLLAIPLLVLGWIVVRIGSFFIHGWKWGNGGKQKTLVGVLSAVIVGAGLIATVQATVPSQRPSHDLTAALAGACRGSAVAGAAALDTSGAHHNHLVVLDTAGNEHPWTGFPAIEWRPLTLSDAEIVACISADETRTEIQVCSYINGPPIHRFRVSRDVVLIEAATAQRLAQFTVSDDARSCGGTEKKDVTELSGELSWEMVAAHASSLIERGVYVAPTPPAY